MHAPRVIAVVGAGLMGHGIAQAFAEAGWVVRVTDADPAVRDTVHARIARNLEEAGGSPPDVLARVDVAATLADTVGDADLVIESVFEDVGLKQSLLVELAGLAPAGAILASNTSVIPISRLGERLVEEDRGRLLGTHWWNPPHLMPLVEVVRTADTRQDVVEAVVALLRDVGKEPVVVHKDVTGFIGNRLNQAMWREALALIDAGVCDAATIDTVVKSSFGLRLPVLGPMENADLIGLDLTRSLHALLFPDLDRSTAPSPVLDAAIARGATGMKAGAGLRRWTGAEAEAVRRRLDAHLRRLNAER
ncbi:3-hydroxyacyl-CoA dehydrogenase family protein [Luteitalea sp. TBR-22]|uniref:3-hydroxyacyl-CoA dehydrogenase family protein n=1 Tax=Luteitalea sp. TBR-22 TaxID=2802971 RepID=UPI001AF36884|nr:3-hydroxyacyl-CoA dehydrogenase family protein [Luteitalea sp. TBR-22]BCS31768.1 3-hydroxyacyl-CoA dehydrogenase family protein [Luteitalea sp. TBR-22]